MLSCASLKGIITLSHVLQLSVSCPQEVQIPMTRFADFPVALSSAEA